MNDKIIRHKAAESLTWAFLILKYVGDYATSGFKQFNEATKDLETVVLPKSHIDKLENGR